MTYSRTTMTPAPNPCRARPATKTAMLPASPATSSPAAKAATPQGSATRGPRRSPASPPTTMPTTEATRKALNGQPYQASPSSSATAVGIAVPTAMASNAMKVTSMSRPAVVRRCAWSRMPGTVLASTYPPTRSGSGHFPPDRRRAPTPTGTGARRVTCWNGLAAGARAEPARRGGQRGPLLAGVDGLGGLRDDGVQVAHDAEVGQLEDRGLGVLVDRHDRLRGLHAGPVLDRPGDADRDVELRADGLAEIGRAHV